MAHGREAGAGSEDEDPGQAPLRAAEREAPARAARQAGSLAEFRRSLRKRRCKAYKRIGSIRQAVAPGQNTIQWNGRIAGRRLRPGRYRALLVITDSAGNKSRIERIRFRVLRTSLAEPAPVSVRQQCTPCR